MGNFSITIIFIFLISGVIFSLMMALQEQKKEKARILFEMKMKAIDDKYRRKEVQGSSNKDKK